MSATIFFACFLHLLAPTTSFDQPLEVRIDGIAQATGDIYLVMYPDESSFDRQADWCYETKLTVSSSNSISWEIPSHPPGRYSIAIYHDVNGNGKMDKNMWGIPREPYAFSRPPQSKWRAPTFEETAIDVPSSTIISMELKRWKQR